MMQFLDSTGDWDTKIPPPIQGVQDAPSWKGIVERNWQLFSRRADQVSFLLQAWQG